MLLNSDIGREINGNGLETSGIVINTKAIYHNISPTELTEHALRRGREVAFKLRHSCKGIMVNIQEGSANDKFIVSTVHDEIAEGKVNRPIEESKFNAG